MGKFDKYSGRVTLKIDELDIDVCPTNRQVAKLMALDKDKAKTEQGFVEMTDVLVDIILKSNPGENKDNISAFVLQKMDKIMTELVVQMGWATRESIDKTMQKQKGKADQEEKKP